MGLLENDTEEQGEALLQYSSHGRTEMKGRDEAARVNAIHNYEGVVQVENYKKKGGDRKRKSRRRMRTRVGGGREPDKKAHPKLTSRKGRESS